MSDELKIILNRLQYYIDKNSNNILLIFDNEKELKHYKRDLKKVISYNLYDFITIEMILYSNTLDGRRFREYRFI